MFSLADEFRACNVSRENIGARGGNVAYTAKLGIRKLEESEIRKQKVDCVVNLYGLRYVMVERHARAAGDRSRLAFEMNRAGVLFAEDSEVQRSIRDYMAKATNDVLIALIHNMGKTTKLKTDQLSNADIESVFLAKAPGPPPK